MAATLRITHKSIGAEVRRDPYDIVVDGTRVGAVEMNGTFETAVEPGSHTVSLREGKNSSKASPFEADDGEVVAYRCTGKRALPLFLASFANPKLALVLVRE